MGAAASVESGETIESGVKADLPPPTMPKFNDFDKIDLFAKEMYLSSPKIDALQHVLSEEGGREAFMKFLRTEYAAENLDFFIVSSTSTSATLQLVMRSFTPWTKLLLTTPNLLLLT